MKPANTRWRLFGLPSAIVLVAASIVILGMALALEGQVSYLRGAEAGISAALSLLILLHEKKSVRSSKGEQNLRRALSFAAASSRSGDPETIIVQGACKFPEVRAAFLLAQAPGSRVEPLILASAGTPPPPMEEILEALRADPARGTKVALPVPSWPGSPQYRILLVLHRPLGREKWEQLYSYGELAGGYLASGTALREYTVAHNRLQELEKQMEAARQKVLLEARNSLLGRLVSNIAHELNNPLAAILGSADLLRSLEKDPALHPVLDALQAEARRCKEIVDQVTQLAEDRPPEPVRAELHKLLEESFNLLQYRFRREEIEVRRQLASEAFALEADETLMTQAFLNLGNALAECLAGSQGPRRLRLETRMEKGGLTLTLAAGATPLARAPYERPSIRLGLWVAGAILEAYGARLDSSGLASGAPCLRVEFPRQAQAPPPFPGVPVPS